jgi:hypothetical protein
LPVRLDGCTVGNLKRFAITFSAVSLLALVCLAPSFAAAAPRSHTPPTPKKCGKPPRGHHHHGSSIRSATIYEVAKGTARPGSKVRLRGVVSAVASSGGRAWLAVTPGDPEYSGPEYSGLEVRLSRHPHTPAIEVGDRVAAFGTVVGDAAGTWLGVLKLKVEFSAVLVRVPNLSVATASLTETTMTTGLRLGNAIIGELPVPFSLPFEFKSVTGIADTLGTGPHLLPRTFADFDLGT